MTLALSWKTEMDYVFFLYGMAFVLLAAVCFVLIWREGRRQPWGWLGVFGLIHGLNEWGDLLAVEFGDNPVFGAYRLAWMALSFAALIEFGRTGMASLGRRVPGRWIYLLLICGALAGGAAGFAGLNASCRYVLGFVGGIWAAAYFLYQGRQTRDHSRHLWTAGVFMAAYAIFAGLIVAEAPFFPASAINQTTFLDGLGFPVQLLRALCAVGIAAAMWMYSERRHEEATAGTGLAAVRGFQPLILAAIVMVIMVCGWALTNLAGHRADANNRREFLARAEAIAAMLDPEWVAALEGVPEEENEGTYRKKKQLLSSVCDQQPDVRFAYVMARRGGQIVFLMDAQPQRSFDPESASRPGDVYDEATPELEALFDGGTGFVEGPVADRWGSWVSAIVPMQTPDTGRVAAVFGMDISSAAWEREVVRQRANGIIITLLFLLLTVSYILAAQYSRDVTLRTAASERVHRTLVDGSPNGILLLDQDSRIARINNAMISRMGWRDEDFTGRYFLSLWPDSIREQAHAALERAQTGRPAFFDAECERADNGARVVWEISLNPVVDHDAHVRRIVCIANDATQRHEAEAALRASEEKYHTLFASSADGVLLMNDAILECNEQFCRMLACSRDDIVGHSLLEFSPPTQPDGRLSAGLARERVDAARNGEPQVFYWRHCRKDGSLLDVEVSLKAIHIGGRRVLLADVRDITERRRTEERLAKINACFLDLGSDAQENIARLTALGGELMDASCAMYNHLEDGRLCSMCQWNLPEDFQFNDTDEHICSDVIRDNREEVVVLRNLPETPYAEHETSIRRYGLQTYVGKAVKCGGRAVGSLCALYRRDFEPGEMEISTLGIVASAIGIEEERLQILRTLTESEERYRAFANHVPLHLAVMDSEGRFTLWNRYSEIMFGYTAEEAVGRLNLRDLLSSREEADQVMEDASALGIHDRETVMRRRDGIQFPAHLVVVSRRHSTIAKAAFFVFAEDITERKQAEEELRKAKNDAEAANKDLEAAIERANRLAFDADMANRAKSQFLATMSHEIRTPMNAIIGMTGLLLDTKLDAEQREFLEIVRSAADSLLALINDILDFSKVEAGRLDLETLDFDLRATIEDTMDMLAIKAHEKGLEFACLIHHDVPALLRGDPGRIRQILINLCNNAIKFTREGEVLVRVTVVAETESQATLRVAVTDTGIGIPQDRMDKLFQLFSQLDASTTRKYGGTGLGLAISKKLVELMGGKIGVESKEGEGSTFWFTIVLEKQPAGARLPVRDNSALAGQRILIVDDNATNRLVFREQLRSYGCMPDEAAGGKEALAKLEEAAARHAPYAAVLVDLLMPDMDGIELGRTIKAIPALANTLLIMVTSRGQRGDAKASKNIGFAGFLTKPVRTEHLRDCLAMVLNRGAEPAISGDAPIITRHLVSEERRRIRILLAEDNVTNQKVALRILEKRGYRADTVADGKEAVAAYASAPYDIILMDVEMPEMDGFEATAVIRKREEATGRHTPIIAMTAHALTGQREKCLDAGMDDYVAKPVRPEELFAAIDRQMAAAHSAGALASDASASVQTGDERPPIFDVVGLDIRMGGDQALIKEIVEVFLNDFPDQMARFLQALQDKDQALAHRQVHSIRGAAASVGAERLRALALQAEDGVRAGVFDETLAIAGKMEPAFAEFRAELSRLGFVSDTGAASG